METQGVRSHRRRVCSDFIIKIPLGAATPCEGDYFQCNNKTKSMAKIRLFQKKEEKRILVTDYIYSFVSRSKRGDTYKRVYRNIAKHISNFQAKTGIEIYLDSFSDRIADEFVYYLRTDGKIKGKGELMINSVYAIMSKLKYTISKAAKEGYMVDRTIFDSIDIEREEVCAVYLSPPELNRINNLKGLSKEAQAVRDRFLIGCFTALRFSDYSKITEKNIIEGNIVVKTRKTGANVMIPVHPIVKEVLGRNKGEFPPLNSQAAFNATLKRVCRKAGIVDKVMWERTVGLKVVRKRLKKYELITTHTARRSGATNMYLAGIPVFRIMLLTGHKTEEAFFRYIRIEKEENARELSQHAFFKDKCLPLSNERDSGEKKEKARWRKEAKRKGE